MMDFRNNLKKSVGKQYHYQEGLMVPRRRWPMFLLIAVLALSVILAGYLLWPRNEKDQTGNQKQEETVASTQQTSEQAPQKETRPSFNAQKLKKVLNTWVAKQSGTAAVVIANQEGDVLASNKPDRSFFAASIYKLYVAYEGYRAVDNGTYTFDEPYLSSWSRGECLDKMIRESHSPCAEKMWVELGKTQLTETLRGYGIKNTSMTAITTSARDGAIMLARIQQGKGLSGTSRKRLLQSLLHQQYRDALPKGFSTQKVYDKVGFREQVEYHDVGIVEFMDKRRLIVSVLTENVGSAHIADLARSIADAVEN